MNVVIFKDKERFVAPVRTSAGDSVGIWLKPHCKGEKPMAVVAQLEEVPAFELVLMCEGKKVFPTLTMRDLKIIEGNIIDVSRKHTGRRSVIYLFPPESISSIDVNLTLAPQWNFSAIYPLTKISTDTQGSQRVKWNVSASANGDLVDLSTGRELSYLFWEAVSHQTPPSPALSAIDRSTNQPTIALDPSRPILNSNNSILLPFTEFIAYLDDTLKLLILHVSARNDFITYWSPHFLAIHEKGQFISMRFLEQVDYEKAAILNITPVPDLVTRVFMLFKGVDSDEHGWEAAKGRVGKVDWRTVVGIKEDAMDFDKFRVLEWGGMEAL